MMGFQIEFHLHEEKKKKDDLPSLVFKKPVLYGIDNDLNSESMSKMTESLAEYDRLKPRRKKHNYLIILFLNLD